MSTKIQNKNKRLVVLDTHAILHRAYHALPDFSSSSGEPTGALYGLIAMLLKMIKDLDPDYIVAAYDLPAPTYRHDVYKDYKAGRAKTDDELVAQIERSRDVLSAFAIPIYEAEGFEADDVIGTIVAMMKNKKDIDVVITSGDMDTLQLVNKKKVQVYTLKKGIKDTVLYDEKAVNERFGFGPTLLPDYKGLRGDPSDNIPGIHGIGEKTATTLITSFGGITAIYKKLAKGEGVFEKEGIKKRIIELLRDGQEEAEFSRMLGEIRRDAPIDFSIPKKPWRENIDTEKLINLLTELSFRTLTARVKDIFNINSELSFNKEEQSEVVKDVLPDKKLKELKIALWLLNSDITNPTEEDITNYTKKNSLKESSEQIFKELEDEKLTGVFEKIEKPLIPLVDEMKEHGVKVDRVYLGELSRDYHKQLEDIARKIYKHAGGAFNINSPKQLGEILFDKLKLKQSKKTATGQRSTRESELEKLFDVHPIIGEVLSYRELQKLLSTYIDTIPKMVAKDKRLHADLLQSGTTTGRMSSQNPNLQNIPIRSELGQKIRNAFVAEKGYKLVSLDYSQIELRIAAFLSGDEKMIKVFKEGGDVHTAVASEVFDVPENKVTPNMRRQAKVINFGVLYGMGVNALSKTAEMKRSDAQKFLKTYGEEFLGLSHYISENKGFTRKNGYTETFFGRRRNLPGIDSHIPYIRAEAERMATNAPIQGTSADIIKIAMANVDEYLKEEGLKNDVFLEMQIHDELVYEVKEDLVERVVPEIKRIMESVISIKDTKGVPILVDASYGPNWGSLKKM
jgi:DNA polymerase-1